MEQWMLYNMIRIHLNCQSEVAIFEVKKEKNPKLTLTKEYGIYRYFKIFGAWGSNHRQSRLDLDGLLMKMLQCRLWRRKKNRYFWVSVAFGENRKAFLSAFSQGWLRIWYNIIGYCLRKAAPKPNTIFLICIETVITILNKLNLRWLNWARHIDATYASTQKWWVRMFCVRRSAR